MIDADVLAGIAAASGWSGPACQGPAHEGFPVLALWVLHGACPCPASTTVLLLLCARCRADVDDASLLTSCTSGLPEGASRVFPLRDTLLRWELVSPPPTTPPSPS